MKENLILTISIGKQYTDIGQLTHPVIEKYAKKINADFLIIDKETENHISPHWNKFIIYNILNKYKRILYVDTDIIIRDDCLNLFDIVPDNKLGIFNEAPFTENRYVAMTEICKEYSVLLPNWNGAYYNTGVMVISRQQKEIFKQPKKEIFNFYEQSYLNMRIAQENISIYDLNYKFNRMSCMDRITGEERYDSYVLHYAGFPSLDFVKSLIRHDIQKWENDKPNYKYKKHILIHVGGGLGDQIDVEPAIRYLAENVYPDDDINIKTHYPQLYEHIKNINIFSNEGFIPKPDTPYYQIETLPNPDTLMWRFISNLLSHTVDFSSIALLRRILPKKNKVIKLEVNNSSFVTLQETISTINDKETPLPYNLLLKLLDSLVLVHPGRHWPSKTFPTEYWQEIIDKLADKLPICIIGKDEGDRGYVHGLKIPENVLDLRDLLNLDELVALISRARLLISNDSAPIHIAGAFDHNIILIPSCKHPDHILPWRQNPKTGEVSQNYKSKALYKKLTLDDVNSQPSLIYGSTADKFNSDWSDYLPNIDSVILQCMTMCN